MKLTKAKRRTGVALLAAVLGLPVHHDCFALKPIIILYVAFESQGTVNQAGTQATLTVIRDEREGEVGDSVVYRITATQAHTGATAVTEKRAPVVPGGSATSPTVKLHPAPGSPHFEPGPIEAVAEAIYFAKDGQIVRTWTWTTTVQLVQR